MYLTSLSESSLAWVYKVLSFANEVSPGFSTTSGAALKSKNSKLIEQLKRNAINTIKSCKQLLPVIAVVILVHGKPIKLFFI